MVLRRPQLAVRCFCLNSFSFSFFIFLLPFVIEMKTFDHVVILIETLFEVVLFVA